MIASPRGLRPRHQRIGPRRPGSGRRGRRARGFTLVEMVVVMTVVALVASMAATLLSSAVAGQQDTRERLEMAQALDGTLALVADEVARALPNSLRVTTNAQGVWLEWVPVLDAARYRQAPDLASGTPGDPLDTGNAADASFDVIGTALATPPANSALAFHNLGTAEADVYSGNNRRSGLTVTQSGRKVSFTAAGALPVVHDNARVFVVGEPVTVACLPTATAGRYELRRYSGYGWLAAQPVATATLASASGNALMASRLTACSASYSTALTNIGLLRLRLGATGSQGGGAMTLLHQVAVDNTP